MNGNSPGHSESSVPYAGSHLHPGERGEVGVADPAAVACAVVARLPAGPCPSSSTMVEYVGRPSKSRRNGPAQKSPAARRTGRSRPDSAPSWSSSSTPSPKSAADRSRVAASTTVAAGVGDLGQHGPAVVGVRAAYEVAVRLELAHDRGDRRGVDLQPLPHLAQRQRAARGEREQHQRLVAGEGEPVRAQDRVEPLQQQLLDPHQRRDGVHGRDAGPAQSPTAGRPRRSGRRPGATWPDPS